MPLTPPLDHPTIHQLEIGGTLGTVGVRIVQRGVGRPFLVLGGPDGASVPGWTDRLADVAAVRVISASPPEPAVEPGHPAQGGALSDHGPAAVYLSLMEALDLTDVTVIGESAGAAVAAELALLGSARVARLILLAEVDAPDVRERLSKLDLAVLDLAVLDLAVLDLAVLDPAVLDPVTGPNGTADHLIDAITTFADAHPAWEHEHTVDTTVRPGDIWATLRDLYTGTKLGEHGDTITIDGPFAVGTRLTAIPDGSDTAIGCTIVELVDGQTFAIRSEFNGLMITSRHTLAAAPEGGTRITQRSTISGPRAERTGPQIGPRITADHPEAMDELITAAGRRHAGVSR